MPGYPCCCNIDDGGGGPDPVCTCPDGRSIQQISYILTVSDNAMPLGWIGSLANQGAYVTNYFDNLIGTYVLTAEQVCSGASVQYDFNSTLIQTFGVDNVNYNTVSGSWAGRVNISANSISAIGLSWGDQGTAYEKVCGGVSRFMFQLAPQSGCISNSWGGAASFGDYCDATDLYQVINCGSTFLWNRGGPVACCPGIDCPALSSVSLPGPTLHFRREIQWM